MHILHFMTSEKRSWKKERPWYLVVFFISIAVLIYLHFFATKDQTDIAASDLVTVDNLVLEEAPVFGKVKSHQYINLKFKNYDKLFSIYDYDVNNIAKDLIKSVVKIGDTLSAGMLKEEYENIKNKNLFDRKVEIQSLTKNGIEFLNLEFRNIRSFKGNNDVIPALIYTAVLCLYFSAYAKRPKYDPQLIISIGALILIFIKSRYF